MSAIEQRARFESWAKTRGLDLCRLKYTKGYRSSLTQQAWAAYQQALTPPEGFVLVPVSATDSMLYAMYTTQDMDGEALKEMWKNVLAASQEAQ